MENIADPPRSKRTFRRNSNSNASMSDTDSTTSQPDSWHSPLPSDSPFRSDDPSFPSENEKISNKSSKSLVPYSSVQSSGKSNLRTGSPAAETRRWLLWSRSETDHALENTEFPAGGGNGSRIDKSVSENVKGTSPVVLGFNILTREEPTQEAKKMRAGAGARAGGIMEEGYGGGDAAVGGERASLRRVKMRKAAMMFRVFEMAACLISFSVMAADKTQGWSGDSYDRYIEYRYCLGVNIIGFVYSGFQASGLACHLGTGNHHFLFHFDFSMDQILSYLVLSASSCAATRVMDWISNWGKDDFTMMASVSIAMSFLAFIAFASSSIISGYNLCCNRDSPSPTIPIATV